MSLLTQQNLNQEIVEEEQGEGETDEEFRKRISEMLVQGSPDDAFKGGFDE